MIVGIGELLWDMYPDGRKVAGGAPFNFAFHCHQLGHEAVIVSRVGDDALGRELREEVKRLGLSDEYIQKDREHPTGTVTVSLDENKVPTYSITENVAWDGIAFEPRLALLAEFSVAMCFGTLAQRNLTSRETIQRFLTSTQHQCRIFDLNFRQPSIDNEMLITGMKRSNWIKMNEYEAQEISTSLKLVSTQFIPWQLGRALALPRTHPTLWMITRGEAGCELFQTPDLDSVIPAVPARVVDTVGAGDAFTAAMVCLHLEGRPLRDCARFANHYAARVCEHQGATPRIDRAEVERAL